MAAPPAWSPELVVAGLRRHFTSQPRFGESPISLAFILQCARTVLGERSPEFAALTLRTAPAALSLREMCREHVGWRGSRSELYRRSNAGAERVAAAFNRDGVTVPEALGGAPNRPIMK